MSPVVALPERCPKCEARLVIEHCGFAYRESYESVPASGRQGLWEWEPSA